MEVAEMQSRTILLDSWIGTPEDDQTFDCWTAVFDPEDCLDTVYYRKPYYMDAVGMSDNPFHPQGFGQHIEIPKDYVDECIAKGQRVTDWTDVPAQVLKLIEQDLHENDRQAGTA